MLAEYGVSLAMITLGADGCYLTNGKAETRVACPKVHPVDTTGAGDIFGGFAVARLLELGKNPSDLTQEELTEIARFATTAASMSTEKRGGIPSIPDRKTVTEYLQRGAC